MFRGTKEKLSVFFLLYREIFCPPVHQTKQPANPNAIQRNNILKKCALGWDGWDNTFT